MKPAHILLVYIGSVVAASTSCSTDKDCPTDATCKTNQCTCGKGFLLSSDNSKCLPYVTEYHGECSENAQCEWLGDNSECKYVCKCKEGYRWYLGQCQSYVGLDGTCSNDVDCYDGYNFQSLKCSDGKCVCADDYYQRGETDCRKKAEDINSACALDMDCKAPNTVCILGKCKLSDTKFAKREELEETTFSKNVMDKVFCETTDDCKSISKSECYEKTGTCVCPHSYFFSKESNSCLAEVGVNTGCTSDGSCQIKPGHCDISSGICYCRDYYFVDDGNRNCIKSIIQNNWNCVSKEWCYALGTYAYCSTSGVCNCSDIAQLDENNLVCTKTRDKDDDMCFLDSECKMFKNGYCVDEHCGCKPNHSFKENVCYPDLGSPCDEDNLCISENSVCDSVCKCANNNVAYENNCYLKREHLGEECAVDVQCNVVIPHSKCVNNKCDCEDDYSTFNNTCYKNTEFMSYCNNRLECTIALGETVQCRSHMCQCATDSIWNENKCSSGNSFVGNVLVVAVMLVLNDLSRVFS